MKKPPGNYPAPTNRPVNKKRKGASPFKARAIRVPCSFLLKVFLMVMFVGTLSLSFICIYRHLLTSPYLRLKEVQVRGVDGKMKDELIGMCGLNFDASLFALRLEDVKRRVESHPEIRSAKVERRFPHTLIIHAEKQEVFALVVMDRIRCMNQFGEIFRDLGESESMDLALVTGVSREKATLEAQLDRALQIMRLLEAEKGAWSLDQLSEIHMRQNGGISVYFNHLKAEINLMQDFPATEGSRQSGGLQEGQALAEPAKEIDLPRKLDRLKRVVNHLRSAGRIHQVGRIDLNYGDGVVVSFLKKTVTLDDIRGVAFAPERVEPALKSGFRVSG